MLFKAMMGAVLLGLFCTSGAAALSAASRETKAKVYGEALPPIGFVNFCAANPSECAPKGPPIRRLAMSPDLWMKLRQVNGFVNGKIAPVSDQDLYGEAERWTYPQDAGDCEDYLLLKKRYLEGMGFPASTLLITVVLDEHSEGHAVLTVATADGDFILDNRRDDILRWNDTSYRFLKRQSERDPRRWVALIKASPAVTNLASQAERPAD